ncbi:carbon storage regulator CsrA [Caldithrix abyssi]|nr:carbon storage regulator CsrA [Caldithrix abyssi]
MLVLTRKAGERIRIGKDVIISVLEHSHRHTKLGISAPRVVAVYRNEVYQKIQEENRAAIMKDGSVSDLLKQFSNEFK